MDILHKKYGSPFSILLQLPIWTQYEFVFSQGWASGQKNVCAGRFSAPALTGGRAGEEGGIGLIPTRPAIDKPPEIRYSIADSQGEISPIGPDEKTFAHETGFGRWKGGMG